MPKFLSSLAALLLLAGGLRADPPATETDAMLWVHARLASMPPGLRYYMRYVWITDAKQETAQSVSLVTNQWSTNHIITLPFVFGNERVRLSEIDLSKFSRDLKDLPRLARVWEKFRFDPAFSKLITEDTLKFAFGAKLGKGQKVVRVLPNYIDPCLYETLVKWTGSEAPIVNDRYYIQRAKSSIVDRDDKGGATVFSEVEGGLYNELSDTPDTEEELLKQLGIKDLRAFFDDLKSDRRAAMMKSGVTGRERLVEVYPTQVKKPDEGIAVYIRTRDIKQKSADIGSSPVKNLIHFVDDAREILYHRRNGAIGNFISDGKGRRKDEVPPDVATDHTVPIGENARLEIISCDRCHMKDGGWLPFKNHIMDLVDGYKGIGIDIFGDRNLKGKGDPNLDDVTRLAGLYGWRPEFLLKELRDSNARFFLRASGKWKGANPAQTDIVRVATTAMCKIRDDHVYKTVTALDALRDCGVEVKDPNDAHEVLQKLLKPPQPYNNQGITLEDPWVAALWIPAIGGINRYQWDLIRAFVVERVRANLLRMK